MKSLFSFILLFLIFGTACEQADTSTTISPPKNIATATPIATTSPRLATPVASFPMTDFVLEEPFLPYSNPVSPNGEWELIEYTEGDIQIKSIEQPVTKLTSEYDTQIGSYVMWPEWSPDSKAIAAIAADKGAAGCPAERIVIYSFSDDNTLDTAVFSSSDVAQPAFLCPKTAWSPDGSRLAVVSVTNADAIYILDQQAEIQQTIPLTWLLPDQHIDQLYWVNDSLFYDSRIFFEDDTDLLHQLHQIPVNSPGEHRSLLQDNSVFYMVWGISADNKYLLVYRSPSIYPPAKTFEFLIIDLTTTE